MGSASQSYSAFLDASMRDGVRDMDALGGSGQRPPENGAVLERPYSFSSCQLLAGSSCPPIRWYIAPLMDVPPGEVVTAFEVVVTADYRLNERTQLMVSLSTGQPCSLTGCKIGPVVIDPSSTAWSELFLSVGLPARSFLVDGEFVVIAEVRLIALESARPCTPYLRAPNFGTVSNPIATPGMTALFSCMPGYKIEGGDKVRKCSNSYRWDDESEVTCNPIPCATELLIPLNGFVTSTTGFTGSKSSFGCNMGYTLTGSPWRECLATGEWSGSADQKCEPNQCYPLLTAPANGGVSSTGTGTGSTFTYSCNAGYTLTGSATQTCLATGSWSNSMDTVCQPNPCSPNLVAPANGTVSCTSGTTGTVCSYSCNAGFSNSGSTSRTCQPSGMWSNVPALCLPLSCQVSLTAPGNGTVSTPNGVTGTVAVFSCNFGFIFSGSSARTCLPTRQWSGLADQVCTRGSCPSLSPPSNGQLSTASTIVGTQTTYACNVGYALVGQPVRECFGDFNWQPSLAPTCSALPCPSLASLSNGRVVPSPSGVVGDLRTFACNAGFTLTGTTSRSCSAGVSPTWSGLADQACTLTPDFCPNQLAPVDGVLSGLTRTLTGTASFACNSGFFLTGSASRRCQADGTWSGSAPVCSNCFTNCVACTGADCLECAAGFNLTANCTARLADFCPVLADPMNGLADACLSRRLEDVCGTTCNTGYFLAAGSSARACTSTGAWSGSDDALCSPCASQCAACSTTAASCTACTAGLTGLPACQDLVRCDLALASPANGFVSHVTGFWGTNATFTCVPGYDLVGTSWRFCQDTGIWTGAASPSCVARLCPALASLANGVVNLTSGAVGDTARYSCLAGYSLSGAEERLCQVDATWTGAAPECIARPCLATLTNPLNGYVSQVAGVTGTVVTYSCEAGYGLTGANASRTCQATGLWTGNAAPTCVALLCTSNLTAPSNGTVSRPWGRTGDTSTFSCIPGYDVLGTLSRTCQSSGEWTGSNDTLCVPSNCRKLDQLAPLRGTKICTGLTVGETCAFACNSGFNLYGTALRKCLPTREWSGSADAACSNAALNMTLIAMANPTSVLVAEQFTVLAILRTVDGLKAALGVEKLSLDATPPGAPLNLAVSQAFSSTTGVYNLTVTAPTRAGSYDVSLFLFGSWLLTNTQRLLDVLPGPTRPASSTADGPGIRTVVLNEVMQFTVTARDQFGNARDRGSDDVRVQFKGGVPAVLLNLPVTDDDDGRYVVSFATSQAGVFTLSVTISGENVLGSPWLLTVTSRCAPGSYATTPVGPCELCPLGTFSDAVNVEACTACPRASTTPGKGADMLSNCTCLSGHYSLDGPGSACAACPLGGLCAGGTSLPRPAAGYAASTDPTVFQSCPTSAACLGNGVCAPGHRGRLCSECSSGFYLIGTECRQCSTSVTRLIAALFLLFVFALCATLVRFATRSVKLYGFGAFVIIFNTLQITAIYGDIALNWPGWARRFFSAFSFVNFNVELTAPECALSIGDLWLFKYIMTMLIPLFAAIIFAIVWLVTFCYIKLVPLIRDRFEAAFPSWCPGNAAEPVARSGLVRQLQRRIGRLATRVEVTPKQLTYATARAYVQLMCFCYMALCKMATRYFDCMKNATGTWVLTSNQTQPCYDKSYFERMPMALFCCALYCLGMPVAIALWLRYKKRTLEPFRFALSYGFLTDRFRPRYYLFEPLGVMVRKLAVVLMTVLFASPFVKALLAGLVLQICLANAAYLSPYGLYWHNVFDVVALFSGVAILWGGMVSHDSVFQSLFVGMGLALVLGLILVGISYDAVKAARYDAKNLAAAKQAGAWHKQAEMKSDNIGSSNDRRRFRKQTLLGDNGLDPAPQASPVVRATTDSFNVTFSSMDIPPEVDFAALDASQTALVVQLSSIERRSSVVLDAQRMSVLDVGAADLSASSASLMGPMTIADELATAAMPPPMPLVMPPPMPVAPQSSDDSSSCMF